MQPFLGPLHIFELKNDNSLGLPIAFECFRRAAAHNVFASVLCHSRSSEFLIFLVTDWIGYFNFNDHISSHLSLNLTKQLTKAH